MTGDPNREQVNLPLVLASWLVGAILIGSAFWLEHYHAWIGVSIATLISVGTAFLLAGALFFLERGFLTSVERIASRTATEVADARIDERVEEVDIRLDQLDQRMSEVFEERRRSHDAAIDAMNHPTFESVAGALAVANGLDALAYGHVTVQASHDLSELGLECSWGRDLGDGRFGEAPRDQLMFRAHIYADERKGGSQWVYEVTWEPTESVEQVGLRLREQLESRGSWKGEETLDWPMALRNLQKSLAVAVRSRRRDSDEWVTEGALFELVDEEWAITDAGLECPLHNFILRETEFPDRNPLYGMVNRTREPESPYRPPRPDWTDQGLWDELLRRGGKHFPIQKGPVAMQPSWIPIKVAPGRTHPEGL